VALQGLGVATRDGEAGHRRLLEVDSPVVDAGCAERIRELPEVEGVVLKALKHPLVSSELRTEKTLVRVAREGFEPVDFGTGLIPVMAGPCSVESWPQLLEVARCARDAGARLLRGGAYKPRSSPYSFQGLGPEGLELLARAREETGLLVVTEALDQAGLDLVAEHADMVQIGTRNMSNFPLLRKAGRCGKPVLLKRGFSSTLEEWLLAAEYVLAEGNEQVVLCERGVRTFGDHARFVLDLNIIPAAHALTHLPIVADPSHSTGRSDCVVPLARAAVAVGADGLMIEVHPHPEEALSDGPQALLPETLGPLMSQLDQVAAALGRTVLDTRRRKVAEG
jgi:3-deoxy-7-phosphoheptulonate synthase